jgi:hypothetical protein
MFALCHAEYLVYQRKGKLQHEPLNQTRQDLRWRIERSWIRREEEVLPEKNLVGWYKDFCEAVTYVYGLFGEKEDECFLNPPWKPPKESLFYKDGKLGEKDTKKAAATEEILIEEYIGTIWKHCIRTQETRFAALYAFTCYWRDEVGFTAKDEWYELGNEGASDAPPLESEQTNGEVTTPWASTSEVGIVGHAEQNSREDFCNSPLTTACQRGDLINFTFLWRQAWYGAVMAQLMSMAPVIFSAFVAGILQ